MTADAVSRLVSNACAYQTPNPLGSRLRRLPKEVRLKGCSCQSPGRSTDCEAVVLPLLREATYAFCLSSSLSSRSTGALRLLYVPYGDAHPPLRGVGAPPEVQVFCIEDSRCKGITHGAI